MKIAVLGLAGVALLAGTSTSSAQCWQGTCVLSNYYSLANTVYQYGMQRRGVPNAPSIGSPQFFYRQGNYPAVRQWYTPAPQPMYVPRAPQTVYMPMVRRR